ncbi:MAG: hypothetical protein ACPIB0_00120 [Akkermansiaceae bacterium]
MQEIDGRVILLILFVVVSAVRWLAEKIKSSDRSSDNEERPPSNLETLYEEFRDEIRQRQTRLQKKQPVEPSAPATTVTQSQRRPEPPAPPAPPVSSPPTAYSQAPATATTQPAKTYKPVKTVLTDEQRAAASRFAQRSTSRRKPTAQTYVRSLLSNPQSARQAIILSEILGKPKSMQRG